jgi:hypothetical protein
VRLSIIIIDFTLFLTFATLLDDNIYLPKIIKYMNTCKNNKIFHFIRKPNVMYVVERSKVNSLQYSLYDTVFFNQIIINPFN